MNGYIDDVFAKYGHPAPQKQHLSPHKHCPINYGAKQQMAHTEDNSPALDEKGVKRIQGIVGDLLYVGRAVNNKLLVALIAIDYQQAKSTKEAAASIEQLFDYVATYPNDGLLFEQEIRYFWHILMGDFSMNAKPTADLVPLYFYWKTTQLQNPMAQY